MSRPKGFKHSQETKDKIRRSLLGHSTSKETRQKISDALQGRSVWNKGKTWPDEVRQKISQTNKARGIRPRIICMGRGARSASWKGGKPRCIDCGKQLRAYSARRCKECVCKGDRAYNWKGGIRTIHQTIRGSIEFRAWRGAVFSRDNWTCQKANTNHIELNAHHIVNFSEYPALRFDIDNGITLSADAHREFHKIHGRSNNTKEQIEEFIGRSL